MLSRPTLHRAFDRHLIGINADYRVVVASDFVENESSPFSLPPISRQEDYFAGEGGVVAILLSGGNNGMTDDGLCAI